MSLFVGLNSLNEVKVNVGLGLIGLIGGLIITPT
jgi:hypothetical protein